MVIDGANKYYNIWRAPIRNMIIQDVVVAFKISPGLRWLGWKVAGRAWPSGFPTGVSICLWAWRCRIRGVFQMISRARPVELFFSGWVRSTGRWRHSGQLFNVYIPERGSIARACDVHGGQVLAMLSRNRYILASTHVYYFSSSYFVNTPCSWCSHDWTLMWLHGLSTAIPGFLKLLFLKYESSSWTLMMNLDDEPCEHVHSVRNAQKVRHVHNIHNVMELNIGERCEHIEDGGSLWTLRHNGNMFTYVHNIQLCSHNYFDWTLAIIVNINEPCEHVHRGSRYWHMFIMLFKLTVEPCKRVPTVHHDEHSNPSQN